jgi:hypothetical protein
MQNRQSRGVVGTSSYGKRSLEPPYIAGLGQVPDFALRRLKRDRTIALG